MESVSSGFERGTSTRGTSSTAKRTVGARFYMRTEISTTASGMKATSMGSDGTLIETIKYSKASGGMVTTREPVLLVPYSNSTSHEVVNQCLFISGWFSPYSSELSSSSPSLWMIFPFSSISSADIIFSNSSSSS